MKLNETIEKTLPETAAIHSKHIRPVTHDFFPARDLRVGKVNKVRDVAGNLRAQMSPIYLDLPGTNFGRVRVQIGIAMNKWSAGTFSFIPKTFDLLLRNTLCIPFYFKIYSVLILSLPPNIFPKNNTYIKPIQVTNFLILKIHLFFSLRNIDPTYFIVLNIFGKVQLYFNDAPLYFNKILPVDHARFQQLKGIVKM